MVTLKINDTVVEVEEGLNVIQANHTGKTLSYKISYGGKTILYMTDNELDRKLAGSKAAVPARLDKAIAFVQDADLLIHDAQFTNEEYPPKIGWEHSTWQDAAWLAMRGQVKRLALFHHDPDRIVSEVDLIVEDCKKELAIQGSDIICYGAREGLEITL